ncbi:MAG: carboxypeptidase regulatory-like domain-containing protein [Candidatus Riflebacteria bacterium]|nr:carboxypeptidase regulatory-like domain-containing protein [Candidatus Riflebacteria bacterium]
MNTSGSPKFILWTFICILSLTLLAGCGGSGGGTSTVGPGVNNDSPVSALKAQLAVWAKTSSPSLNLSSQKAQTASSTSLGTVTFRDLSGVSWIFNVLSVTYATTDQADILVEYFQTSGAKIDIDFMMSRTNEGWIISDINVTGIPDIIVITNTFTGNVMKGTVTEKGTGVPISGALVALISATGVTTNTSSDASGYYEFTGVPAGTYTLVISRDGYVIETKTGIIITD